MRGYVEVHQFCKLSRAKIDDLFSSSGKFQSPVVKATRACQGLCYDTLLRSLSFTTPERAFRLLATKPLLQTQSGHRRATARTSGGMDQLGLFIPLTDAAGQGGDWTDFVLACFHVYHTLFMHLPGYMEDSTHTMRQYLISELDRMTVLRY